MNRNHFTNMKDEAGASGPQSKELVGKSLNEIGRSYLQPSIYMSSLKKEIINVLNLFPRMQHRERSPPKNVTVIGKTSKE